MSTVPACSRGQCAQEAVLASVLPDSAPGGSCDPNLRHRPHRRIRMVAEDRQLHPQVLEREQRRQRRPREQLRVRLLQPPPHRSQRRSIEPPRRRRRRELLRQGTPAQDRVELHVRWLRDGLGEVDQPRDLPVVDQEVGPVQVPVDEHGGSASNSGEWDDTQEASSGEENPAVAASSTRDVAAPTTGGWYAGHGPPARAVRSQGGIRPSGACIRWSARNASPSGAAAGDGVPGDRELAGRGRCGGAGAVAGGNFTDPRCGAGWHRASSPARRVTPMSAHASSRQSGRLPLGVGGSEAPRPNAPCCRRRAVPSELSIAAMTIHPITEGGDRPGVGRRAGRALIGRW